MKKLIALAFFTASSSAAFAQEAQPVPAAPSYSEFGFNGGAYSDGSYHSGGYHQGAYHEGAHHDNNWQEEYERHELWYESRPNKPAAPEGIGPKTGPSVTGR